MSLLAAVTHGQAVSLVILFICLIAFIIVDIYLVLSLRRKNKKLAKDIPIPQEQSNESEKENTITDKEN